MDAIRSRNKRAWIGTVLTIVIGLSAWLGIIQLRDRSDARREGQLILAQVEIAASRQTLETMNILAVGLASRGDAEASLELGFDQTIAEVHEFRDRGDDAISRLQQLGFDRDETARAAAMFRRLQRELDIALTLLDGGDFAAAYVYGLRRVKPTFEAIEDTMEAATASYGGAARRARVLGDVGMMATVLTALGLLFMLRRRLDKERRRFQSRLEHEALHDPLTDLPNRRLFKDRVETACRRKARGPGTAVMFIDLDGFKNVNDSNGHDAGDRLLRGVAERLGRCVRAGDTVARIGGDEFAIVLTDVTQPIEAVGLANRILETLSTPFDLVGVTAHIGASIGIAILNDNEAAEELCTRADTAMYAAKRAGRGAYRIAPGDSVVSSKEPVASRSLASVS